MFTGIIEELGKIEAFLRFKDRIELTISTRFISNIKEGDSIAVNGVCLTVKEKLKTSFKADVVIETISRTTLQNLKVGNMVNIERALLASGRLDGHMVQGHVDAKSIITNIISVGSTREIEIKIPAGYEKYVTGKGSIAVDGVSLTIVAVYDGYFKVAVIPHTAIKTNLPYKKIGDFVNLEFDVLVKYLEGLFKEKDIPDIRKIAGKKIDEEFLKYAGFMD